MIKIIKTDSYFNIFPILLKCLDNSCHDMKNKNLIFSEEKISLMTERCICSKMTGSFNTEVSSLKKYLLKKRSFDNLLSREASTMVIKKLLGNITLKCFNNSKTTLAQSLFDLIIQLKSASVSPQDIFDSIEKNKGILKSKLTDIYSIYSAYEEYLKENNKIDQSSELMFLPDIIEKDEDVKKSNVFIIGYNGFTAQIREIIAKLCQNAKSFTAILPNGENTFAFVNETAGVIKNIARDLKIEYKEVFEKTDRCNEAEILTNYLFSPYSVKNKDNPIKKNTDKIFTYSAKNPRSEYQKIASVIKEKVINEGKRYKDFAVILPEESKKEDLIEAFNLLNVPYFLDDKFTAEYHPLVTLLLSYLEVFRRGFKREDLVTFFKNPLIVEDKAFADRFENYLIKRDINYNRIKNQFADDEGKEYESFRQQLLAYFDYFNPKKLFERVKAEEKLSTLSEKLKEKERLNESAVNEQVYNYVVGIINAIEDILGKEKISLIEYKNILTSGIASLKISVIPQYSDAVFVGDFREVGLAKTDYIFISGLTTGVPIYKDDVSILTDNDINTLSEIKVIVEPKIKIVNQRIREQTLMGFTSFDKGLYLSYSINAENGKQNEKSDLLLKTESMFDVLPFPKTSNYLTESQAFINYAKSCGEFATGKCEDIEDATSFYNICKNPLKGIIIDRANRELKVRLENNTSILQNGKTSPTSVEDYFACPYKAFLDKVIRLNEREEGKINASAFGIIVHEVLNAFMKGIDKTTVENFEEVFGEIKASFRENKKYQDMFSGSENEVNFEGLMREAKKYCYKNLLWKLNGRFTTNPEDLEVRISKNGKFKPLQLLGGKVNITGTVDRIDTFDKYYRVIDFKTGKYSGSTSDLYYGNSLQLYLYALAVKNSSEENDEKYKEFVGAYYMPIRDSYKSIEDAEKEVLLDGSTLDSEEILNASDINYGEKGKSEFLKVKKTSTGNKNTMTQEELDAFLKYSYLVSEKALKNMNDGVIVPSPTEKACNYCKYKAVCDVKTENIRKCPSVNVEDIVKATKEEK